MIRDMKRLDIPSLIMLGAEMHKESTYKHLDFDPVKLWALGDQILANPDSYCAFVAEKDGEIIGLIIGYAVPHFFGNDLMSGDLAVYVDAAHRKGMTGARLVKAYLDWCDGKGVKCPMLGVSAGISSDKVGRLYERLGLTDKYQIYRRPML